MTKFDKILKMPLPSKMENANITIKISDHISEDDFLFTEDQFKVHDRKYIRLSQRVQNATIWVYGKESTNPHFHIKSNDKKFVETCIRLDDNRYFNHGYKTGTLTNDEIKSLIEVLNKPFKKTGKEKFKGATTVFSAMCLCWNADLNNIYKVENVYDIPDYLNIREADNIPPSI